MESTLVSKKDGSVFGTLAPSYRHRPYGVTFSGEVNTKRDVKFEVKAEDPAGVIGAATTLTLQTQAGAKLNDPQQIYATVAAEYRHDNFAGTVSVDFGKFEGSTAKASAAIGSNGFTLGANTVYHVGVSELKELDTSLTYSQLDYDATVYGKMRNNEGKTENTAGVKYFHAVSTSVSVGADFNTDLNNPSKSPRLTVATQLKPDSISYFKLKADSEGKVGGAFVHKLSSNAKLTVSATVDANNLSGKNATQFGATLAFTY